MDWGFDNTYARELAGFYREWQPTGSPAPELVALNDDLAVELGLDPEFLRSPDGLAVLAGNAVPEGAAPLAQAYAGHQFGQFNPMLGDGRAVLLGEVIDTAGRRRDIAFKGSGRTPFSRGGDGKAVLGPVLREYIIGEAMHALGIPTTRSLSVVATGRPVYREGAEPGEGEGTGRGAAEDRVHGVSPEVGGRDVWCSSPPTPRIGGIGTGPRGTSRAHSTRTPTLARPPSPHILRWRARSSRSIVVQPATRSFTCSSWSVRRFRNRAATPSKSPWATWRT